MAAGAGEALLDADADATVNVAPAGGPLATAPAVGVAGGAAGLLEVLGRCFGSPLSPIGTDAAVTTDVIGRAS